MSEENKEPDEDEEDLDDEEEYDDEEYEDDDYDDEDYEYDEDDDGADGGELSEEEQKAAKKAKTKKIILIAAAILVPLGITAGVLIIFKEAIFGKPTINEVQLNLGAPVTIEFGEIRTDLKKVSRRGNFIRLKISIQLNENDVDAIEANRAAIEDGIQRYLREQEFKDLQGKAGTDKLRFDLLTVINVALAPVKAHTIFFNEIVVQ